MKIKDEAGWANCVKINADDLYGAACVAYALAWADEMEACVKEGACSVAEIAKNAAHAVDRRPGFGITGFMYGCAVSMLSKYWEHGEELRRWHNIDAQLGTEGEKANESGGVLNPALVSVG